MISKAAGVGCTGPLKRTMSERIRKSIMTDSCGIPPLKPRPGRVRGGWLTVYTDATHWVATKSITFSPISEIGGHLTESRGAILRGARGLTLGQTRNGSEEGGSALVREWLEAHGGPRDREYHVLSQLYAINAEWGFNPLCQAWFIRGTRLIGRTGCHSMHTYVNIYTYCMYVRMYICLHAYIINACLYEHTYICMNTYLMHACLCTIMVDIHPHHERLWDKPLYLTNNNLFIKQPAMMFCFLVHHQIMYWIWLWWRHFWCTSNSCHVSLGI